MTEKYADYDAASKLSPEDEKEHALYVERVAAEYGFPLSNWVPTISSRDSRNSKRTPTNSTLWMPPVETEQP